MTDDEHEPAQVPATSHVSNSDCAASQGHSILLCYAAAEAGAPGMAAMQSKLQLNEKCHIVP